jgi:hypothetical protein
MARIPSPRGGGEKYNNPFNETGGHSRDRNDPDRSALPDDYEDASDNHGAETGPMIETPNSRPGSIDRGLYDKNPLYGEFDRLKSIEVPPRLTGKNFVPRGGK